MRLQHLSPSNTKHTECTVWDEYSYMNKISFTTDFNPSVVKKTHVPLCFGFSMQTVRRQDTSHSFHFGPAEVWALYIITVPPALKALWAFFVIAFPPSLIVYDKTALSTSPIYFITNPFTPKDKAKSHCLFLDVWSRAGWCAKWHFLNVNYSKIRFFWEIFWINKKSKT